MPEAEKQTPGHWAIVLAGGEGERLKTFIRERLGSDKPKQYCKLTGGGTLLEETLRRVAPLVPAERIVTVIGGDHRRFLNGEAALCGCFIEQPLMRETAPGIFLPAAHVLRANPSATVLILPSDHFIAPGEAFLRSLGKAALLAEEWSEHIVLLGAVPEEAEQDYGWIEPDWAWSTGSSAMQVLRFEEKPGAQRAERLLEAGCLWNTMIMAVKVRTLWEIGRSRLPSMMRRFEALLPALGTPAEKEALLCAYQGMESLNFSREILEKTPERVMVLPMSGVEWSDLGRPARVDRALKRIEPEKARRGSSRLAFGARPAR